MSENAKKAVEQISARLADLPNDVADSALEKCAVKMEGFAEGFAAAMAMKEEK